eukprot:scaffold2857_cov399-Prasinococcus_capsulatus_cf.AAC.8
MVHVVRACFTTLAKFRSLVTRLLSVCGVPAGASAGQKGSTPRNARKEAAVRELSTCSVKAGATVESFPSSTTRDRFSSLRTKRALRWKLSVWAQGSCCPPYCIREQTVRAGVYTRFAAAAAAGRRGVVSAAVAL